MYANEAILSHIVCLFVLAMHGTWTSVASPRFSSESIRILKNLPSGSSPGPALISANRLHLHHASHLYSFFRPSHFAQDHQLYINTVCLHRMVHSICTTQQDKSLLERFILGNSLQHTRLRKSHHLRPRFDVHPTIPTRGYALETTLWTHVALWGRWF